MKHFSHILFLLLATLSSVTLSHAQTTIVTDNLAPGNPADHGAYKHWDQFSTTLSASPSADPTPDAELTLGGITYQWSGGNGVVHLTSYTSPSVGFESSLGTELKPFGQNSITVTCKITYAENDSAGNYVKDLSLSSGSITVKFFSRIPARVKEFQRYQEQGSPYYGTPDWGQVTDFDLQLQDNQPFHQPYGGGDLAESFPSVTGPVTDPNYPKGPYTWYDLSSGSNNPYGNNIVNGNFTDHVGVKTSVDARLPPVNWTANTVTSDFQQGWTCYEAKPPYPSAHDQATTDIPHHHVIVHYMMPTERTGG